MVFTQTEELDVLDTNGRSALVVEHLFEMFYRFLAHSGTEFLVGARHATGCITETIPVWILPDREKDLTDRALNPRKVTPCLTHLSCIDPLCEVHTLPTSG